MYSETGSKEDCTFCRIIAGDIPSDAVYQDEEAVAIRDINPKAPVHLLIMPKAHIPSPAEAGADQTQLLGHLVQVASELARREGISDKGYRLVINSGLAAGQEVPHLHIHLLGGRQLEEMG